MTDEMGLKVYKNRFELNNMLYPIHFALFESKTKWGHFNSHNYQIGINKALMHMALNETIRSIIRHELAHYMCFLKYGNTKPHGEEFKKVCNSYNWNSEVSQASGSIDELNNIIEGDLKSQQVLNKVKKLLALSSSTNEFEAKKALNKANELLFKYNLESLKNDEDEAYVLSALFSKRSNSKLQAIYEILQNFFVVPVFNYGNDGVYLDICGDRSNIEVAEYVAKFLDSELENLWKNYKKMNPHLKGIVAKNSYFRGLAKGFCEKFKESTPSQQALIPIKNSLIKKTNLAYGKLRKTSVNKSLNCDESHGAGRKAGNSLNINPSIKNNNPKIHLLN